MNWNNKGVCLFNSFTHWELLNSEQLEKRGQMQLAGWLMSFSKPQTHVRHNSDNSMTSLCLCVHFTICLSLMTEAVTEPLGRVIVSVRVEWKCGYVWWLGNGRHSQAFSVGASGKWTCPLLLAWFERMLVFMAIKIHFLSCSWSKRKQERGNIRVSDDKMIH